MSQADFDADDQDDSVDVELEGPVEEILRVTPMGYIWVRGKLIMWDPWMARQIRCIPNLPWVLSQIA